MPATYYRGFGQRSVKEESRWRVPASQWYDPYFFILASQPEKMVMAELVRRGIYFEHTPQTNPIEWGMLKQMATSDPSKWEADFLFPQFKIWLEVQGAYFHTMPGVPFREALRFELIEAAGWKPIYWWDYDIETRLQDLMNAVPEFYAPPGKKGDEDAFAARDEGQMDDPAGPHDVWHSRKQRWGQDYYKSHHNRPRTFGRTNVGLPFYAGGYESKIDHLAGLRKANANRAQTPQFETRYRKMRYTKRDKRYGHYVAR